MVAAGEVGEARRLGGGLLFFRMGHVFGLQGQEASCFFKPFFVKYFNCREHPGSLHSDKI